MKTVSSLILIFFTLLLSACTEYQERDFLRRDVQGILIGLEAIGHGQTIVTVRQSNTADTIRCPLYITSFLRSNEIKVGDSLSKPANNRTLTFFKRKDIRFREAVELEYGKGPID